MSIELGSGPTPDACKPAAQSLCLACGLCCDGTLFSHVTLGPNDNGAALALGINTADEAAPQILKQHCAAYKNCSCTIYQNRPIACRDFQCALLRRFKERKISQAEALKIIRNAATLRDEVKEAMRGTIGDNDYSFKELTARLMTGWKDADSVEMRDRVSELFQRFAVLWLHLNKNFRV